MDNTRSTAREWVHGLTALILGLLLLGVSSGLGVIKDVVDLWGSVLFIPEYPAVVLRDVYLRWRGRYYDTQKLNDEVIRLRNENAKLRLDLAKFTSAQIYASSDTQPRTARITLRAPMSWWSEIRLDRGEQDGVTQGLPVFSNGYLAGRVSSVSRMTSWAELITSPSFMIPAVIDETRELGVVAGDGSGAVLLKYIPAGRGVKAGMKVSTAMIGENLPPGLPIGQVTGERKVEADGYATYRVEPGADMSRFYVVSF